MSDAGRRDPGRRCSAPGCVTVLSVYNSDHLCFAHADRVTRARFEQRAHVERQPAPYRQVVSIPSLEPSTGEAGT